MWTLPRRARPGDQGGRRTDAARGEAAWCARHRHHASGGLRVGDGQTAVDQDAAKGRGSAPPGLPCRAPAQAACARALRRRRRCAHLVRVDALEGSQDSIRSGRSGAGACMPGRLRSHRWRRFHSQTASSLRVRPWRSRPTRPRTRDSFRPHPSSTRPPVVRTANRPRAGAGLHRPLRPHSAAARSSASRIDRRPACGTRRSGRPRASSVVVSLCVVKAVTTTARSAAWRRSAT